MKKFLQYIRSLFCKHDYIRISTTSVYDTDCVHVVFVHKFSCTKCNHSFEAFEEW